MIPYIKLHTKLYRKYKHENHSQSSVVTKGRSLHSWSYNTMKNTLGAYMSISKPVTYSTKDKECKSFIYIL